uniref:sensor histidine kinase n=1 Tax=Candidatus Enterococcus willemsii TaxID=1857215 RepID=UPI00403F75F3
MNKRIIKNILFMTVILFAIALFFYVIATQTIIGESFGVVVSKLFTRQEVVHISDNDEYFYGSVINWYVFKRFLIFLGCILIVIIGLVAYLMSQIMLKKERKRIAALIEHSLESNNEELFSKEYAEIGIELDKIKVANEKAQQRLAQETSRTKDFITFLAHDLRTPLASIIGYIILLIDTPEIDRTTRAKYLNIALEKAYRLEQLVEEFFYITRFEFQEIVLDKTTFKLSLLLEQLGEEFYPIFHAKNQQLRIDVSEKLDIKGDPEKLVRVFNNILKNASAYGYEDSEITVVGEMKEKQLQLIFTNYGPTIPEEKLAKIFDKFYRLDTARSSVTGGSGLGLSIAKEIVEAHGGTISVTSEEGKTEFIILLPQE